MDPNTCYREMIEASNEGNKGLALEYATDLKNWLERGGFEPDNYDEEMHLVCLRQMQVRTPRRFRDYLKRG